MARKTKDAPGRVTPKGGQKAGRVTPTPSSRYTPPIPKEFKVSPKWVPVLMFTCLGLGMVVILGNYLGFLPGGASNGYLMGGLALITGGFIVATRYH
jgi:Cell division protein CrgA